MFTQYLLEFLCNSEKSMHLPENQLFAPGRQMIRHADGMQTSLGKKNQLLNQLINELKDTRYV